MGAYDEIINLPHHVSDKRQHMSLRDRAAQFSPFAALTGYDDAVAETARLTGEKRELTEDMKLQLDRQIAILSENEAVRPEITVTYFVSDSRKDGGEYVSVTGFLRRVDTFYCQLIFTDGKCIAMSEIWRIESELFRRYDDN